MPTLPSQILTWIELRFLDENGDPLSNGSLEFYVTGTSTPKNVYSDGTRSTSLGTTVDLAADGRPADPIYLGSGSYKVIVKDENDVEQYTIDPILDSCLTFFGTLGNEFVTGDSAATSGDSVTTEAFVAVTSAGGDDPATINLPAASGYGFVLTIKNKTAVDLQINPDGSDTIEDGLASYTIPAAVSPLFPTVRLASDGVSVWWVLSGIGI